MATRMVISDGVTPYIIDGAKTGNSSTTTGVRLLGPKEGPFEWTIQEGREAEIMCRIRITADTTANLITRVNALLAILNTVRGRTVEVRYDSTNVMFQLPLAVWTTFAATTGTRYLIDPRGGGGAEIDVLFTSQKLSSGSDRGSDDPTQPGGNWQYVRRGTGLAVATAERVLASMGDALTWVNGLRNKTLYPDEISDDFEVIEENFGYADVGSSPIGNSEVAAKVLLQQKSGWIAGDARFDAFKVVEAQGSISDITTQLTGAPDDVVNKKMAITGSLILKTDKAEDFDSNDSSVTAPDAISGLVSDAIDAVVEGMEERMDEDLKEISRRVSYGDNGEITFGLELLLDETDLISWSEEIELSIESQVDIIRDYGGKARTYPRPGGAHGTMTHTINMESFSYRRYTAPSLPGGSDKWEFTSGRFPRTKSMATPDQPSRYVISGSASWVYKPDGTSTLPTPDMSAEYDNPADDT